MSLIMVPCAVDLYWVPLGTGSRIVPACGRAYEAMAAARAHRPRCQLYHAALEVRLDDARWTVESAPAWDRSAADRGVVGAGPVGVRWLGRWQWFRYEVRRWRDGVVPDLDAAVDSPVRLTTDRDPARRAFAAVETFPTWTWGRDEQGFGDMWNSNSLIAWTLVHGGLADGVAPPVGGRAPGWSAGAAAAQTAMARRRASDLRPDGSLTPSRTVRSGPMPSHGTTT